MKKNKKKPAAETLVKSILEDLQSEVDSSDSDASSHSEGDENAEMTLFGGGKKNQGLPLVTTRNEDSEVSRKFPEGLEPEDDNPLFDQLREKPSQKPKEKAKKGPPMVVSSPPPSSMTSSSSSTDDRTVSIQDSTAPAHGRGGDESNSITFRRYR